MLFKKETTCDVEEDVQGKLEKDEEVGDKEASEDEEREEVDEVEEGISCRAQQFSLRKTDAEPRLLHHDRILWITRH